MATDPQRHPGSPLGNLSAQSFLQEYWQRRPLLIRQAVPAFASPLTPDELAGLACEADVEARIISGHPAGEPWHLRHGPFDDSDFATLGERDWTLLVQAVDHYVPAVAALRDQFRFIPDWRLDDVMVSFAAPGGSVGPHFDQYDVFLLQGEGRREWQIGAVCNDNTPLQAHDELRLLASFEPTQQYTLHPGDMLYLPPGVAHWGVALDPCTTYSIGFRAPSHGDIISHYCDHILQQLDDGMRYGDPDLQLQDNPGLVGDAVVDQLAGIMAALSDRSQIADWFARYMTEPKYPDSEPPTLRPTPSSELLATTTLRLCDTSRSACRTEHGHTALYVDGICYPDEPPPAQPITTTQTSDPANTMPAETAPARWQRFVHTLCTDKRLSRKALAEFCQDSMIRTVITTLLERGALTEEPTANR